MSFSSTSLPAGMMYNLRLKSLIDLIIETPRACLSKIPSLEIFKSSPSEHLGRFSETWLENQNVTVY
ncbi:uncharacterized protein L3040_008966 [Drepanopeziza brunnea f. sp. 'multigermtubi']|uniref:uncharacterized protein n=1 Tax=Drepanopeziza brunnea f. sp. 'multigermtubi' TaxID=698441 RepID=UPI0023A2A757|nr:hypothetical protein L3040_008966 [Drepanopeziza brunnea f. sp. 'multigermtubi']